jgi:hypothetical protein
MTYLVNHPACDTARDSEVLEFWSTRAQYQRAAAEAFEAYLGQI